MSIAYLPDLKASRDLNVAAHIDGGNNIRNVVIDGTERTVSKFAHVPIVGALA